MQCKDISDLDVLRWLNQQQCWATWIRVPPDRTQHMPCVLDAMPSETPIKLAQAKMKRLIARGLADGCTCGCRGDYEITNKGRALISGE